MSLGNRRKSRAEPPPPTPPRAPDRGAPPSVGVVAAPPLRILEEQALEGLEHQPGGFVQLRRDIYHFVAYVQKQGLTRSVRENQIPRVAARRLAKLLSFADELEAVALAGCGVWSDHVSHVALALGVVHFKTEGIYAGYTSQSPSTPSNEVSVHAEDWRAYLALSPRAKERRILDALIRITPNEFFEDTFLCELTRFDSFGRAIGPASRMKLTDIRQGLLEVLQGLEPGRWYDPISLAERLEVTHPNLIIDRRTLGPDAASQRRLQEWTWSCNMGRRHLPNPPRPEVTLELPYENFREHPAAGAPSRKRDEQLPPISGRPDAWLRVEGRYLEYFLAGIPHHCGFVDLAWRAETDPHGQDVLPHFQRLRAFRLTPRFFQVMGADPAFERVQVTVMPNFEVIVDAASYPEVVLARLAPFTTNLREDGPITRMKLERQKVVEARAAAPDAPPVVELLKELSGRALPENVATELEAWSGRGEKLILFEGCGLVELRGDSATHVQLRQNLAPLVVDDRLEGFLLVRSPAHALEQLEQGGYVPERVRHPDGALMPIGPPPAASPAARSKGTVRQKPVRREPVKVKLEPEDLVGFRCSHPPLLKALHEALKDKAQTCALVGQDLLVLSAASLSALRGALRGLSEEFDVQY